MARHSRCYVLNPAARLARWKMRLNMFDCDIIYHKGADALSRLYEDDNQDDTESNQYVVINFLKALTI
jgi:hypothetical protein